MKPVLKRIAGLLGAVGATLACSTERGEGTLGRRSSALEIAGWTEISPGIAATSRAGHVLVYDRARENTVVFGGRPVPADGSALGDTGLWSGSTWVAVDADYGKRGDLAGAYDVARARVVTFGGYYAPVGPTGGPTYYADTWEFNGSTWMKATTAVAPAKRSANGLAYDVAGAVTLLFGGYSGHYLDDLWQWDGATWGQLCSAAPCSTSVRPAARANAVFVYDEARQVTLLFGGAGKDETFSDTWIWDGQSWTAMQPAQSPAGRSMAAATYDPVSERILVFGGLNADAHEVNDFWAWDGTNWTSVAQATAPVARQGARLAWDVKRRRGILFGGSNAKQPTDAQEFVLLGSTCATSAQCHVGKCSFGVCLPGYGTGGRGAGSGGFGGDAGASGGATAGGGESSGGESSGGSDVSDGAAPDLTGGSITAGGTVNTGGASTSSGGGARDSGGGGAQGGAVATPSRSFYACTLSSPPGTGGGVFAASPLLLALLVPLLRRRSSPRAA